MRVVNMTIRTWKDWPQIDSFAFPISKNLGSINLNLKKLPSLQHNITDLPCSYHVTLLCIKHHFSVYGITTRQNVVTHGSRTEGVGPRGRVGQRELQNIGFWIVKILLSRLVFIDNFSFVVSIVNDNRNSSLERLPNNLRNLFSFGGNSLPNFGFIGMFQSF